LAILPVLLFSVTCLGEDVSLLGVSGILLVVFGVYTISMKRLALSEISRPLLSVAAYSLVDKVAVGKMHPVILAYTYPWISLGLYRGCILKAKPKNIMIPQPPRLPPKCRSVGVMLRD
jgi:hypothetical protein